MFDANLSHGVSVQKKKTFLKSFLKEQHLKRRESVWILNYLQTLDSTMAHVHFVHNASVCPLGLVLGAVGTQGPSFQFYKGNIMTTNAEKSFQEIRTIQADEHIYIQLEFPDGKMNPQYAEVLEENPFEKLPSEKDGMEVEALFSHCQAMFRENQIRKDIDDALDNKDRVAFERLSRLLN